MVQMMFWEAVRRAHDEEMTNDPLVICMGEDIGVAGGTYKATNGLYAKYGPERVMDTPISENGFTGLAVGAAFLGVRPFVEIMSVNFAWLSMPWLQREYTRARGRSSLTSVSDGQGAGELPLAPFLGLYRRYSPSISRVN